MNNVFKDFPDKFMIVFVDDMLIYSSNYEMYVAYLKNSLETLRAHQLYGKILKCFWLSEVVFLGHVISVKVVAIDLGKI